MILCAQVGANDQLVFDGYSVYVNERGELCQLAKGFQEDLMLIDLSSKSCIVSFNYDAIGDLFQALVLGTRDYFQKQNFRKAIVGLSGGIDSALTACIAVEALGKENVYALSMPSQFNSPASLNDAKTLVKHLGIDFDVVPIDDLYATYLKTLTPFFQGKPLDETEENIQSRIRGSILMAFSNKLGYLLISTGNKSELGMGYCTLYGDMAGGLGVIADVSKTQVYMLARWINRKKEIIPQSIIDKPPSAKLKFDQRDTDTLPDYAIVDAVLQAYVEDLMAPDEIVNKHGFPLELVLDLVHRIHASEYKRRQSAPGIRVTKKAFRVGRHYPIVQKWV